MRLREPANRVSPRAKSMWRIGAVSEGTFTGVAVASGLRFAFDVTPTWWAVVLALLAITIYAVAVPEWRYRVHRWEVTDTAAYTQKGWWSRERRIAPMSRIQTVDFTEGAIERLFGLASVTITTASAAGALSIDALRRHDALALVDELTHAADAVEGDAT